MNERTDLLIGDENREKIDTSLFVVLGLGGVGGTALEVLSRFGAVHFILLDGDIFESSNLNRQILSNLSNIGRLKTECAKERILSINKSADVVIFSERIDSSNIENFVNIVKNNAMSTSIKKTFVVDAIDDVRAKCMIYASMLKNIDDVKIVAAMGAGRAFYSPLEITSLSKTHTCPLAKAVRSEAKKWMSKEDMDKITAIFSPNNTIAKPQDGILPSSITQTFNMGLTLARETIKKALA